MNRKKYLLTLFLLGGIPPCGFSKNTKKWGGPGPHFSDIHFQFILHILTKFGVIFMTRSQDTHFFYKNLVYKNIQAQMTWNLRIK